MHIYKHTHRPLWPQGPILTPWQKREGESTMSWPLNTNITVTEHELIPCLFWIFQNALGYNTSVALESPQTLTKPSEEYISKGKCPYPLSFSQLKSAHIYLTFGHSVDLITNIHVTCFETFLYSFFCFFVETWAYLYINWKGSNRRCTNLIISSIKWWFPCRNAISLLQHPCRQPGPHTVEITTWQDRVLSWQINLSSDGLNTTSQYKGVSPSHILYINWVEVFIEWIPSLQGSVLCSPTAQYERWRRLWGAERRKRFLLFNSHYILALPFIVAGNWTFLVRSSNWLSISQKPLASQLKVLNNPSNFTSKTYYTLE
jgi:hypothetical protein